jgi:hypothetical protein
MSDHTAVSAIVHEYDDKKYVLELSPHSILDEDEGCRTAWLTILGTSVGFISCSGATD